MGIGAAPSINIDRIHKYIDRLHLRSGAGCDDIAYFAEKEGLSGHARSALVRFDKAGI